MESLSLTGFFGGSNALWETSVLRDYGFRQLYQTEDVDVTARAVLDNYNITFCPEARSGEREREGERRRRIPDQTPLLVDPPPRRPPSS